MPIVSLYAALFGFMLVILSLRTVRGRYNLKANIGDANNSQMLRLMRAHGNFTEYVPMTLFLIFLAEQGGTSPRWIHSLCIVLLVGRISHAYGISQVHEDFRYRKLGMALTFSVICISSVLLLSFYFQ
jgi:uncharacterized membrane protein YecN with MAPEG domain